MQNADLRGRRANSDDLPALQAMWREAGVDSSDLDPRFTEFQVIEDALGTLVAAIGIRIVGQDALLHSETIPDFGLADRVRPIMWDRLTNLAKNNGLARVWTQESAPFWRQLEFTPATGEQLAKLPGVFRKADGSWMLLVMRDEDAIKRVEQEFELFRQQERARIDELKSQGKIWQWIATTIAIFLFVFVVVGAIRLLKNTQRRNDSRIERMAKVLPALSVRQQSTGGAPDSSPRRELRVWPTKAQKLRRSDTRASAAPLELGSISHPTPDSRPGLLSPAAPQLAK